MAFSGLLVVVLTNTAGGLNVNGKGKKF